MPKPHEMTVTPSSERRRIVRPDPSLPDLPSPAWLETVDLATAIAHIPYAQWFQRALIAAELIEDLRGDGPLTVLVPTDAAIDRFPCGAPDWLFDPEEAEALIDLAEHHVARGALRLEAHEPTVIATLVGAERHIAADELGLPSIAPVVRANLRCNNGIVHIVDELVVPRWLREHCFERRVSRGLDAA